MNSEKSLETLKQVAQDCIQCGRFPEAQLALHEVLDITPNDKKSREALAKIYLNSGSENEAIEQYYEILRIDPKDAFIRSRIRSLHQKSVSQWHYPMLNDEERNESYRKAIEACVRPDMIVLEIGTGSGLLAMLAARAGAKHVYTCEQSFPLASVARKIIATNGLGDKISIVNKWSTDINVGKDLPEKADLLVSEIFGSSLVNENMIEFYNDARLRLLKPGAPMIPESATIHAMLLESDELREEVRVSDACGFDVSLLNGLYDAPTITTSLTSVRHKPLTAPFAVFDFSFRELIPERQEQVISIEACSDGICQGVAVWFSLTLADGHDLDSSPESLGTHWRQEIQIFENPFPVKRGWKYRLEVRQFDDRLVFVGAGEE